MYTVKYTRTVQSYTEHNRTQRDLNVSHRGERRALVLPVPQVSEGVLQEAAVPSAA